jgi:hypothetical protein
VIGLLIMNKKCAGSYGVPAPPVRSKAPVGAAENSPRRQPWVSPAGGPSPGGAAERNDQSTLFRPCRGLAHSRMWTHGLRRGLPSGRCFAACSKSAGTRQVVNAITPLSARKRRRHCVLPAQSKTLAEVVAASQMIAPVGAIENSPWRQPWVSPAGGPSPGGAVERSGWSTLFRTSEAWHSGSGDRVARQRRGLRWPLTAFPRGGPALARRAAPTQRPPHIAPEGWRSPRR